MRTLVLIITCLCLAWAPAAAIAQERNLTSEQEAALVDLIEEGKTLYDQGEFSAAREKFRQAYEIYPHPDIIYRIALCHERLGEDQQAVQYYRKFLAEAPDAPERARVEKTIEVIEARIAKSEIRVTTEPDGAVVYIDDEANGVAGYTPTALAVKPGNYKLIVKKEGYEPIRELVTVTAGATVQVRYQLTRVGTKAGDDPIVQKKGRRRRPPSVAIVALGTVGVASGVASYILLSNYGETRAELDSKPKSEFTREQFNRLQTKARTQLVAGIGTAAVSVFALIWAYGLAVSDGPATAAAIPALGWSSGPTLTWIW